MNFIKRLRFKLLYPLCIYSELNHDHDIIEFKYIEKAGYLMHFSKGKALIVDPETMKFKKVGIENLIRIG